MVRDMHNADRTSFDPATSFARTRHDRALLFLALSTLLVAPQIARAKGIWQAPGLMHFPASFIGFTPDSRFAVMERNKICEEGSGWTRTQITLVDVARNAWVGEPIWLVDKTERGCVEANGKKILADLRAKAQLEVLKRVRKAAPGAELVPTTALKLTYTNRSVSKYPPEGQPDEAMFEVAGTRYRLVLTQWPATDRKHSEDEDPPFVRFALTLANESTGKQVLLQKDDESPKSRGDPYAYAIQSVHVRTGHIAVLIEYVLPGFEGYETATLLVTGPLP